MNRCGERSGAGWLTMPLLAAAMGLGTLAEAAQPERYELDVRLDPTRQYVAVDGRVSLQVEDGASSLSFGLHETFRIAECAIGGEPVHCERVDPGSPGSPPAGREVTVALPEAAAGGCVELDIRYEGAIQNRPGWGKPDTEGPFLDDSAGPDRIELALYSNWYPFFGFGPTFDVEMEVAAPPRWVVTAIGKGGPRTEGVGTKTRWEARAVNDVVIVASPKLRWRDVETTAGRVRIHHTSLPESYLSREARETEEVLLLFARILGHAPGSQLLQQVYSPRDWGQGFARPGMIVMSEGRALRALAEDPDTSFVHGNAHEAAHFWWRHGRDQGDWINETFAEYFAILAVRAIQGEGAFQGDLDEKRGAVRALPQDAPALAVVPFNNDRHGYTIRYFKGALMLDAFREQLGDEAFFDACRGFYEAIRGRSVGTGDFRAYWTKVLRDDDDLLMSWLDSPGSVPVSTGDARLEVHGEQILLDGRPVKIIGLRCSRWSASQATSRPTPGCSAARTRAWAGPSPTPAGGRSWERGPTRARRGTATSTRSTPTPGFSGGWSSSATRSARS